MKDLQTLNLKEVESILKLSRNTLYRLVQLRKIRYVRAGRQIRFLKEHIENYLRDNEVVNSL